MSMKKMLAVVAAASLVAVAAPAFAANPFSDVPMNHWAYDAVEELASKGILEGYPNGTFKGNRAMTRYEIATMVARMMNAGLTGADLEKLKALVVEFQPELDALGVKVDGFDSRLTALEKGVGGWKITGQYRLDYKAWDKDEHPVWDGTKFDKKAHGDGFYTNRFRLMLHKDLSDGITFDARYQNGNFDRAWITARDFFGMEGLTMKAGDFVVDWEDADGLYEGDEEAFFLDAEVRGFDLKYTGGMFTVEGFAASNMSDDDITAGNRSNEYYGARIRADFSEKLWMSLNGMWVNHEKFDGNVYWAGLGFKFMDGAELKGAYYMEDLAKDSTLEAMGYPLTKKGIDDPKAWKIIADVKQDVLKFTSLWVEYAKFDEGFVLQNTPYGWGADYPLLDGMNGADYIPVLQDMDVFFVRATQNWNDKWKTFERYCKYDMDNFGDAKEWTIGVGYQYSPNLYFELSYDDIDLSSDNTSLPFGKKSYDDNQIRFRTFLTF